MKKSLKPHLLRPFALLLAAVLLLAACYDRVDGTANGALLGSVVGGALGGILGGPRGENVGSLVGVLAGSAAGYGAGAAQEKKMERRMQRADERRAQDMERAYEPEPRREPRRQRPVEDNSRAAEPTTAEPTFRVPGYRIESPTERPVTQTVAHRGEWRSEGSAENSRASLQRALDMQVWGSEIDVWLTTDGHVMVNHDPTFQGISLQDTTYKACKRLTLSNGEKMPQLQDLLKLMRRSQSPTCLVLEVKKHRSPQRSRDCAAAAVEAVRKEGLLDRTVFISFSIEACQTIHELLPDASVSYLTGDRTPVELYRLGINGIDYNITHLRQHPEWVEQAHRLNMSAGVWTVDSEADMLEMQQLGVDFITTNEPARCERLLRQP